MAERVASAAAANKCLARAPGCVSGRGSPRLGGDHAENLILGDLDLELQAPALLARATLRRVSKIERKTYIRP
jgi:hypothetical protein